jgi:hypothetical protein
MAKQAVDSGTPEVFEEQMPTLSTPVEEHNMGLEIEPQISVEQRNAQQAALRDHLRRANPSKYSPLPNGHMVEVRGRVIHKYPGAKKTIMLADPARIIDRAFRKPNFGADMPRYQWRCRTDVSTARRDLETAQLHRQGRIRYVEVGEIDRNSEFAVIDEYAVPGPSGNVYVIVDTMILCEILDPEHCYEKYKFWTDLALENVSSLPQTVLSFNDTHIGQKTTTVVTQKDVRQGG